MAHKTKYLCGLLFCLLFSCILHLNSISASAVPLLSASTDKSVITQGDEISISINMKNNPQISSLGMVLKYDSSILQYDSSTWNGSFSSSDIMMASDAGDAVNLSVVCNDSYLSDGTIVTVRFIASQSASSVPASLVLRDMTDASLSDISNCSVDSTVRVVSETVAPSQQEVRVSDTDLSNEQPAATSQQQKVSTPDADFNNSQHTSLESVTSAASVPESGSSKVDENYKTGNGYGKDVFLLAAVMCGIFALVLVAKKEKGEGK